MCTCVRIRSQRYNNFRFRAANRVHNKAMGNAKWGFLTMKQPQGGLKTMAHSTMQEDATGRKPGLLDKDGTRAARLHGIPSLDPPHKAEPAWADALQTQHAASPNATRCTSHHTALPYPSRNSTFCRASGKPNHNCPLLPVSDKQASARLRPPGTHCSTAHSPAPSHRPRPQAFLCSPRQYRNPTK